MLARLIDFFADHAAAVVAGSASVVGTGVLAAGAVPVPSGVPEWVPFLFTVFGPMILVVGTKVLAALAKAQRTVAAKKRERAAKLRADKDPTNDKLADQLDDQADFSDALADGLDTVASSKK